MVLPFDHTRDLDLEVSGAKPYFRNGRAGWHGMKGMWVDHSWPWPWPWVIMVGWVDVLDNDRNDFRRRRAVDILSYIFLEVKFHAIFHPILSMSSCSSQSRQLVVHELFLKVWRDRKKDIQNILVCLNVFFWWMRWLNSSQPYINHSTDRIWPHPAKRARNSKS